MIYLLATKLKGSQTREEDHKEPGHRKKKLASHEDLGKGVPSAQRKRGLLRLVWLELIITPVWLRRR